MVSLLDENRVKGQDMTGTSAARIVAMVMGLATIGLVSAAASPQAARDNAPAQAAGGRGAAPPVFRSPEVMADRRVVFRIFAPKADEVRLAGTDIPRNTQGIAMTKADNGVWEVTIGPLEPGAYRYHFNVNGVSVIDPRSPTISQSNNNVWSMVHVPGAAFMDTSEVPHGSRTEEAFAKFKALLRQAKARTVAAVEVAIGQALDAITPRDARQFFAHCGYGIAK